MGAKKRPPANVLVPKEWKCKWCDTISKRHCGRCRWYPCTNRACRIVTILDLVFAGEPPTWKWQARWVRRDAKFSSE